MLVKLPLFFSKVQILQKRTKGPYWFSVPATTYHEDLGCVAHVVLPGDKQHVGQVVHEVDDASAGGRQVGA